MSKTILNFWLDATLLAVFSALCCISAILQFVFPVGPSALGWTLWGWDYIAWRDLQFATLCLFSLGVLVHVMLHWSWVCGVITTRIVATQSRPDDGIRTIWGVATLIVLFHLLAAVVAAALFTIQAPAITSTTLRADPAPRWQSGDVMVCQLRSRPSPESSRSA